MCGFLTAINIDKPWADSRFNEARDTLIHRGPDACGSQFLFDGKVAIGHRRLSILDLSPAGNQPMQLANLWVVYNGEVYNFRALRKELEDLGCLFRTQCDTEVLLHGYQAWGEDLPKKLLGMFAFTIWDDEQKELFGARDHAGQKPFYYYFNQKSFIAASEVKAIASLSDTDLKTRREAFKEFFIYDDIPDPNTWYQDVYSLPPGHALKLKFGGDRLKLELSEYWSFVPPVESRVISESKAVEEVYHLLNEMVKMHQIADVDVGAFLSGGLDSSGIVAFASKHTETPLQTFSIGFENDEGELPLARKVAEQWGCSYHEHLVTSEGFLNAFNRSLDVFDMPFGDSSQFPTFEVARFAASKVKVVLTGDGGDEVFGGYWNMGRYMGRHKIDTTNIFSILSGLVNWQRNQKAWNAKVNIGHATGDDELVYQILGPEFNDLKDYDPWDFYLKHWHAELDPFRSAQWNDFKCYLPTVLKKVDRCTMQHSLEARCPILSPPLIEAMFNLSTAVRNPDGRFKHLYSEVLRTEKMIPQELFSAEKKGFGLSDELFGAVQSSSPLLDPIASMQKQGVFGINALAHGEKSWGSVWRMALVSRAVERNMVTA